MRVWLQKVKDFFVCIIFRKNILQKVFSKISIEDEKEPEVKCTETHKKIKQVMDNFDFECVSNITGDTVKSLRALCKKQLTACYLGALHHEDSYWIEAQKFRFHYNYYKEYFVIEYILCDSGKEYL